MSSHHFVKEVKKMSKQTKNKRKKIFKVVSSVKLEIATLVEASNEKEAENIALDRLANGDITVCIHGSEMTDGLSEEGFVLTDGDVSEYGEIVSVDEK